MNEDQLVAYELNRATPRGDCLITAAWTDRDGYGQVRDTKGRAGATVRLHRLVLEHKIGRKLARDELACHACNTPSCINPKHLYAGNSQTNVNDRDAAGRRDDRRGERNTRSKFTEDDVRDIRRRFAAGGILQKELAAEYGVRAPAISRIIAGERWPHVT